MKKGVLKKKTIMVPKNTLVMAIVIAGILSWLIVVGIVKVVTILFGWGFSWIIATFIWLLWFGIRKMIYLLKRREP